MAGLRVYTPSRPSRAAAGGSVIANPTGPNGGQAKNNKNLIRVPFLHAVATTQLGFLLDGVIHGCYFLQKSQQYFSSAMKPPYDTKAKRKYIMQHYGRCRELSQHGKLPTHICVATAHECFYVWCTPEYHLYLTVPRGITTSVIGQFYQWVNAQSLYIFLAGTPTW